MAADWSTSVHISHIRSPVSQGVSSQSMSVLHPSKRHSPVTTNPLHSASVHIREFPGVVNPRPWEAEFGGLSQGLGQDYLSPRKLIEISGERDLKSVTYMDLTVNSADNSLGNFGCHVPNLSQLRLIASVVPCVRDMGTSLDHLTILWMPRCRLKDLDGLPALASLKELYLAFNQISDVCLVSMLSSLETLDIESNELVDLDQLGYLSLCPALSVLTLEGNPLCTLLATQQEGKEKDYRSAIFEAMPNLTTLDDQSQLEEPQFTDKGALSSHSSVFVLSEAGMERDWQLVTEGIKGAAGGGIQELTKSVERTIRPATAPHTRERQSTTPPPPPSQDDSSELTHGLEQVICGNPVRALRRRKKHTLSSQSSVTFSPSHDQELLAQVHSWRLDAISEADIGTIEARGLPRQQPDHSTITPRLPSPPKTTPTHHALPPRPQTVADFRHRRYRKTSTERTFPQNPRTMQSYDNIDIPS